MALEGYFLFQGDRTVCGGKIITGAEDTEFFGRSQARESDKVTCGKHPGIYRICGGMGDMYEVGGVNRQLAGSIESYSSCPCRGEIHSARFG
ncbi:PAAR domain-containing protein [Klebsiella pneumoniae]